MKISSKKYIDNQIKWVMKFLKAELKSVRDDVDKVERTNDLKFAGQNEWRGQFKDQTNTFLTRREFWGAVIAIGLALVALYFKK